MSKTNAARILEKHSVAYELFPYEVDENDLSATTVAAKLGQDVQQVFKTLVLRGDKTGVLVAVIPGGDELDLKKTAKASGNKFVEMVPLKEILGLTGYVRGGCTPIGMKKKYPVIIHESCINFDFIFISAGMRGLQMKVNPQQIIKITDACITDLV